LLSGVAGELALAGRVRRREDRVGLLPGPTCRRRASCHLLPGPDRRSRRGVRACTRRTRGAALSPRRPVDGASARGAAAAYTPARRHPSPAPGRVAPTGSQGWGPAGLRRGGACSWQRPPLAHGRSARRSSRSCRRARPRCRTSRERPTRATQAGRLRPVAVSRALLKRAVSFRCHALSASRSPRCSGSAHRRPVSLYRAGGCTAVTCTSLFERGTLKTGACLSARRRRNRAATAQFVQRAQTHRTTKLRRRRDGDPSAQSPRWKASVRSRPSLKGVKTPIRLSEGGFGRDCQPFPRRRRGERVAAFGVRSPPGLLGPDRPDGVSRGARVPETARRCKNCQR
jgi:hypothetical protein